MSHGHPPTHRRLTVDDFNNFALHAVFLDRCSRLSLLPTEILQKKSRSELLNKSWDSFTGIRIFSQMVLFDGFTISTPIIDLNFKRAFGKCFKKVFSDFWYLGIFFFQKKKCKKICEYGCSVVWREDIYVFSSDVKTITIFFSLVSPEEKN